MYWSTVKIGDIVTRMLAGTVPMKLKVSGITGTKIVCGSWEFNKITGEEIDEDIPITMSYLKPFDPEFSRLRPGTRSTHIP